MRRCILMVSKRTPISDLTKPQCREEPMRLMFGIYQAAVVSTVVALFGSVPATEIQTRLVRAAQECHFIPCLPPAYANAA